MAPATPAASSSWSRTDVGFWHALMRAEPLFPRSPSRGLVIGWNSHGAQFGGGHPPAGGWPTPDRWFWSERFPACANLRAISAQAARCPGSATEFKKSCFRATGRPERQLVGGGQPGAPGSGRSSRQPENPLYCSAEIKNLVAGRPIVSHRSPIGGMWRKCNTLMEVSAILAAVSLPGSGERGSGDLA